MRMTKEEAEIFLYREARLLDEGSLEEWLNLFSEDGIYWIPIAAHSDPELEPSILYDDAKLRARRVHQIVREPRFSQKPASRTVHLISNVEVEVGNGANRNFVILRCNLVVFELRPGGQEQYGLGAQRWLAGRCEYHLRHENEWRIVLKKVVLIERDLPVHNLTFIV